MEGSIINQFVRDIHPKWLSVPGYSYNSGEHVVRWPNGSLTRFGHAQNEKDIFKYQGYEFLFIGVDELTTFTLKMWQFLISRNRCAQPNAFPTMAGASNPGNIGHTWVKSLWIDKKPAPGMERAAEYDPNDYAFIRATLDDNPVYSAESTAGLEYRKKLNSLPSALYRAFALGDWDIFAGQYFDVFSNARHVVHNPELKPWWPRWISMDWGFEHPSAAYWHAKDGDRVITYREFVRKGMGEADLGRAIAELSKNDPKMLAIFLDPSAFAKRGSANTIAEQLNEEFRASKLPLASPADNDRIGGARLMHELLAADLWQISDNCPHLIECLPTMIHDEDNMEDVLKVNAGEGVLGDDPYDAARYGLKSMLGTGTKPVHERVAERIHTDDPFSRAIWQQKFEREEKNKSGPVFTTRRWRPRFN